MGFLFLALAGGVAAVNYQRASAYAHLFALFCAVFRVCHCLGDGWKPECGVFHGADLEDRV